MSEKTQGKYSSQFDKVKEITDRLEAGVLELMNSESYKTFLKTMAHFHAYSLNNTHRPRHRSGQAESGWHEGNGDEGDYGSCL